jgi:HK97 family phage major capsid protein
MPYNEAIDREGAEALMPEEVSREIIKALPAASIALTRMRRVRMSRAKQRMPVLSALAQAYFVGGDTGLKQTTKLAWGNKFLNVEEVAVILPVPEAVLDDSDYDLWAEAQSSIIEAAGALVDQVVLFGAGRPDSWPLSIVEQADAAGNEVVRGAVAGRDLAGDANAVMKLVAADGHPVNGFAADALLEYDLQDLRDDQGRPVFTSSLQEGAAGKGLYGRPFTYLNNGAWDETEADLIAGDWTQAIIGIRQDITFSIHRDGVISDDEGNIVLNLMQQDSVAMRMVLRLAFQVANPITRRTAGVAEADRSPFGVLRPVGYVG